MNENKTAKTPADGEPVIGTKTWFEDGNVVTQNLYASDIYKDPPKQPEQEPVAFIDNEGKGNLSWRKTTTKDIPLYAAPPHYWGNVTSAELVEELRRRDMLMVPVKEQEPEWIDDDFGTMWQKCGKKDCGKFVVRVGKVDCWNGDCPEKEPKREWVGLTEDEKDEFVDAFYGTDIQRIEAIDAKLKEKNGG